jgi:uncharacterized protein YoxC
MAILIKTLKEPYKTFLSEMQNLQHQLNELQQQVQQQVQQLGPVISEPEYILLLLMLLLLLY